MAVIGTFGTFTTARLGIYASQASLQVTGNNIANINTKGYTRQRADLVSLNSTGVAHYANPMGVDIGYGVLVKSTTQLRDPYLDIRFRNQNTDLGSVNATLDGLNKLAQTLDEVNKGGSSQNGVIENALQNFKTMIQGLEVNVGSEEYDGLVREAAKSLTTFFNTASEKLQNDWDLQADELRDTIKDVNKCLTNIRDLNEQIRKQGIYGDLALELRDARNLYIDELSEYLNINVEYSMERIDQYTEVEKLTISLANTKDPNNNNQPIRLVDGLYGAQITMGEYLDNNGYATDDANGIPNTQTNCKFLMQVEQLKDKFDRIQYEGTPKESQIALLGDNDLHGSLQAMRELLTEEGEFASKKDVGMAGEVLSVIEERAKDSNANIKKGIPYYQKRLDLLAQKFAEVFNEANQLPASTVYQTNAAGEFVKADGVSPVQVDVNGVLTNLTVDMVTKEKEITKEDGTKETVRVPLDRTDGEDAANAAKYLEALRDEGALSRGYEFYDGGVLFSSSGNNNDPTGITAGNISIANSWASRVVRMLNKTKPDEVSNDGSDINHSSDNDNIDHFIYLFEKQLEYSAKELEPDAAGGDKIFFHGSFQEMYTDIGGTLGSEQSTIMGIASNYELMTLDLDNDRISVSGVDLNDEATGMMQFQKSYQAACRLLTTIDSMLDTLINGTAR